MTGSVWGLGAALKFFPALDLPRSTWILPDLPGSTRVSPDPPGPGSAALRLWQRADGWAHIPNLGRQSQSSGFLRANPRAPQDLQRNEPDGQMAKERARKFMCKCQEKKMLGSKMGGHLPQEEQGPYRGFDREMHFLLQAPHTVNHVNIPGSLEGDSEASGCCSGVL